VTAVFAIGGIVPSVPQLFRDHYGVVGRLDCPLALKPVLARALEPRPRDRFASMAEFEAALRSAIHRHVEVPPAPPSLLADRVDSLSDLDEAGWGHLLQRLGTRYTRFIPSVAAPPRRRAIALARLLDQAGDPAIEDALSALVRTPRETTVTPALATTHASDGDDWESLIDALTAMEVDELLYLTLCAEFPQQYLSLHSQWQMVEDLLGIGEKAPEVMDRLVGALRARPPAALARGEVSRRPALEAATSFAKMQFLLGRIERAPDGPAQAIVERVSSLIRARRFAEFIAAHDLLAIDFYRILPRHALATVHVALPCLSRLRTLVEELPPRWKQYRGDDVGVPAQNRRAWLPAYQALCRAPAAAFEDAVRVFVDPSLLPFDYRERATRALSLLRIADKWLGSAAAFQDVLGSQTAIACANEDPDVPPPPGVDAMVDRFLPHLDQLPSIVLDELSFRVGADSGWDPTWSSSEAALRLSKNIDAKALAPELRAVLGHIYARTGLTAPGEEGASPSIKHAELFEMVQLLDGAQFAGLVERLGIPEAYLPPVQADMAQRGLALVRLVSCIPTGLSQLAAQLRIIQDQTVRA
jgi:hypothetical protein